MNEFMTLTEICLKVSTRYRLNQTTDVKLLMEFFIKQGKLTEDELRRITEIELLKSDS